MSQGKIRSELVKTFSWKCVSETCVVPGSSNRSCRFICSTVPLVPFHVENDADSVEHTGRGISILSCHDSEPVVGDETACLRFHDPERRARDAHGRESETAFGP